jgi:hypothetical protein
LIFFATNESRELFKQSWIIDELEGVGKWIDKFKKWDDG